MDAPLDLAKFTLAYHQGTGEKRYVPTHWLNTPPMSDDWRIAPSARDHAETSATTGDEPTPDEQSGANPEEN